MPDMNINENTQLANQLETFKQGNDGLKATIEDLEAKNTNYAEELENLLSSLRRNWCSSLRGPRWWP